ncbi:Rpn family recombination-promoting nuclease/putative transposase [Pendulispora albinea]|uniref:Rpn family recombination-promoting nuclease/putative transposase n=1 Tax=Pendulispora albinea TaxID=2741071 RepID=A0ABZ2LK38_9BACT
MTTKSPHDALFKAAFGRSDIARSELETVLPPALRERLDLRSLELQPGSFVDEELESTHSDLLYETRTVCDVPALVYVLFEHQSSFDAQIPFRLLRYAVRVWNRWLVKHPGNGTKLPILVSVVLHHGAKGWRGRPDFASVLDANPDTIEATRPYVPHFDFVLDDLASLPLETLATRTLHVLGRLVQIAFWTSRSTERFEQAIPLMRDLAASTKRDASTRALLVQLYVYLNSVLRDVDASVVSTKLIEISGPEGKEDVMTAAEQLMNIGFAKGEEKGFAKGEEKGFAKGEADAWRRAIEKALAARNVPLGTASRARLLACTDVHVLEQWHERALTVATENDLFNI